MLGDIRRDLENASKPLRPRTAEESRRAVQALGLDEDQGKQCLRCFKFKATDEFYTKGWQEETPLYNAWCKECCRARAAERKLPSKNGNARNEGNP